MNNILQLKGAFDKKKNTNPVGAPNIPVGDKRVTVQHLQELKSELNRIKNFWLTETLIGGALVSVYYSKVVAKSNRLKGLLAKGTISPNESVRGARFVVENNHRKHVFTHFVSLNLLDESMDRLEKCSKILSMDYNDAISHSDMEQLTADNYTHQDIIAISNFKKVIVDAFYVERFTIDRDVENLEERSIVTLYETKVKTIDILHKLGIDIIEPKMLDKTTVRLEPDELEILKQKAPYLIAMTTFDIRKLTIDDISSADKSKLSITDPKNEPIIGVIDTLFDEDVYFSKWVTNQRMLDENIETDIDDCFHGTAVTSIIVDGPAFNPDLEDNCGRFRVNHFGVATKGSFSSFTILKAIREAVTRNPEIKVWNLSLGSALEISQNFISPEAAELDRIQTEFDVIFVVAGTNKKISETRKMRIGAPADSLNSLVVNAVDSDNEPASYHRVGPVLSFFHKPDVSYYGGDGPQKIRVCGPLGEHFVSGTSFAAPWITRKIAYLIYHMGFSREVAKALLIDSAAGWNRRDDCTHSIGYGVVPIKIEDIVQTPDDEIRFIMTGVSDAYETYSYRIPVPFYNDKHPFFARATLCYFPTCSRNQGVDYTDTELDIHFGRVKENKGVAKIKPINNNQQGDTGFINLSEEDARDFYRKWDNIKHINDTIKERSRPREKYGAGLWGLSIKVKERFGSRKGMPFGVVITLREMNGVNRIDDFIKLCTFHGWIVNNIDLHNRFDIFNKAEEDINFD